MKISKTVIATVLAVASLLVLRDATTATTEVLLRDKETVKTYRATHIMRPE